MARPAMTDVRISGSCPECREEFGLTIGPHSTIMEAWHLFYKAYEEHHDAVHVDSWQKLARDAVRGMRPIGRDVVILNALQYRLEKLEATNANR